MQSQEVEQVPVQVGQELCHHKPQYLQFQSQETEASCSYHQYYGSDEIT